MKAIEPGLVLRLFIRTSKMARIFCDGRPVEVTPGTVSIDVATQPPFEVVALPGDRVTIALDGPYAANPGRGQVFLVGLNARWESKDVGAAHIFGNLSDDPVKAGAQLEPAPIARKHTNPPDSMFGANGAEYDDALRSSKTWFSLPGGATVPWYADLIGWQHEFESQKVKPIWIGDEFPEGSHFAVIIAIPEE
jgi:hypothetical protein